MYNFLNIKTYRNTEKQGFTLIEVIVSIALFATVMTIALGALFMVIAANRQAKAIKLVVNNINLAMEGMTRDLRVGYDYCLDSRTTGKYGGGCDNASGSDEIYFLNAEKTGTPELYTYRYNATEKTIERRTGTGASNPYRNVTGSDLEVEEMKFYIQGTQSGDTIQPYITIAIRGTIRVGDIIDDFHLQSTISQRRLAP